MKRPVLTLLLFCLSISLFGQGADTLTPEKKARWRINKFSTGTKENAPVDLRGAFNAVTDMALKRTPFLSVKELRKGLADTAAVVFINEGLRSGIFRYDPKNVKDSDDSSMVLVSGKRRYIREEVGFLKPEWFGADPTDELDDADAIQKMMNAVPASGAILKFANGEYYIGKQINYKAVSKAPKWYFKVIMEGAGVGRTQIFGKVGFKGDMFVINTGAPSGQSKDNYITIQNIEFRANTAKRILYGTEVTSLKIYDCMFFGGEDCGIQLGIDGANAPGGYSVYFKNNYHNGQAYGGGQINSLLRLNNTRFFVIDGMESDGGKYSIEMLGPSDKNIIVNCKLEGAKRAAIYINNTIGGGGENQILNSTLNPYVGIEAKALFDGENNCIEIVSQGGGNAFNTIRGNLLLAPTLADMPIVASSSEAKGNFTVASASNFYVTGQKSGAVGYVSGYNSGNNKIVINSVTGKFVENEIVVQASTRASTRINKFIVNHSHAVKLTGGGGTNIIAENRIRQLPEFGIYNESNNNVIIGNAIEALNGIFSTSQSGAIVSDNSIFSPGGVAVTRVNGVLNYSNNRILGGKLTGISETYLQATGGTISGEVNFMGKSNLNGEITAPSLPVYSDNAAATAGGLTKGALYRTSTGDVKVKY